MQRVEASPYARCTRIEASCASDGDEHLPDRATLDGSVCGGHGFEVEPVERQPGALAHSEGTIFNRLIDVRRGRRDAIPAHV